jgi:hypothetical protein
MCSPHWWGRLLVRIALELCVQRPRRRQIRLTRPANYAPPTASPSTRLKLRRQRLEAEHVNDRRAPIDLQQQNIYLYIELDH